MPFCSPGPLLWRDGLSPGGKMPLVEGQCKRGKSGAARYRSSLRGAKRRSNPAFFAAAKLDCFASLAMTVEGAALSRPSLPCSRAMRLARRAAMRRPAARGRMAAPFGAATLAALEALLQRIHQADHIVGPLLALGHLDRLAGGLAPDQRLQCILVLVLEL